jgi:hypothetical protein
MRRGDKQDIMTCSQRQVRVRWLRYRDGTWFAVPISSTSMYPYPDCRPRCPGVWGRFYPPKPPAPTPRFPQDDGAESKAKQTSTNPKRRRYVYFVLTPSSQPYAPARRGVAHRTLLCLPSTSPREFNWVKLRPQSLLSS